MCRCKPSQLPFFIGFKNDLILPYFYRDPVGMTIVISANRQFDVSPLYLMVIDNSSAISYSNNS